MTVLAEPPGEPKHERLCAAKKKCFRYQEDSHACAKAAKDIERNPNETRVHKGERFGIRSAWAKYGRKARACT